MPKTCKSPVDVDVVAVGHGKTDNKLHYAQLKTKPMMDCKNMVPTIDFLTFYVCTRAMDDIYKSVCKGNSGGPVVTMSDDTMIAVADFLISGKMY